MCGINGILNLNDTSRSTELIGKMNDRLSHRGPDDHGIFLEEGIVLGHRRLSIIDLSAAGHQPMFTDDGRYAIVYNGELYNFQELKFDLQRAQSGANTGAYLFKTNSDTEVILAAFARWGKDCLHRFKGMFSLAIWDTIEKKLFIARDRLGIKPLYYYKKDDLLIFSSELRSLLASGLIKKQLDQNSLVDYLRYQTVHAPATIIKDVKMLLPGHYILASKTEFAIKRYWTPDMETNKEVAALPYEKVCDTVNELFHKAVERRLIADVPFGAFLSGGIDSSAVVAAMSKVSSGKVKTFCITFEEKKFSEAAYARMVADKFGTEHHEILLKPEQFLEELRLALSAMDHPSGDGPNTFLVSGATKKAGITMALSGLGGDELFAGYNIFDRAINFEKKRWAAMIPVFMRRSVGAISAMMKASVRTDKMQEYLKLKKFDLPSVYPLMRQVLVDKYVKKVLRSEIMPNNRVAEIADSIKNFSDADHRVSRVSVAEINTYMQNVLLRDTDQMSMNHALEVRVPFLDHELVEFVLSVPDQFKLSNSPKKLLVDSMKGALPNEIVNRPKMGFTLPWEHWMKNELRELCETSIKDLAKCSSFNGSEVKVLWERFLKNDPCLNWSRLWHLVVLGYWLKKNEINE